MLRPSKHSEPFFSNLLNSFSEVRRDFAQRFAGDFRVFDDLLSEDVGIGTVMGLPRLSCLSLKMSSLAGFGAFEKVLRTRA
jgi:hypothetical protein